MKSLKKTKFRQYAIRFNKKTNTYTFTNNFDKTQTKKGFVFDHFLFMTTLNGNSIAVYNNKEKKEFALVHEYHGTNTRQKPIFKTYEEFEKIIDKLNGINDISNLAIMLNRYFDCNFDI